MTRAAIYSRCSTEEQADRQLSLPAQVAACRAHAKAQGLLVVAEYEDAGVSGGRADRPGLQAALAAAQGREWAVLLIWDLSRLSRETVDALQWWRALRQWGVQLVAVSQPLGDGAEAELLATQLWSVATYQRRRLAVDTRRGVRHAVESGHWLGGPAPYGYRRLDKRLVVEPEEAAIVRQMVRWRVEEGLGTVRIADRLGQSGIRTRRGRAWDSSSVHRLLCSPALVGDTEYVTGRTEGQPGAPVRVADTHEAIISREEQAALGWHCRSRGWGEPGSAGTAHVPKARYRRHVLSGLLRCHICGRPRAISAWRRVSPVGYYVCRRCRAGGVRADVIEPAVLRAYCERVLSPEELVAAMADADRQYAAMIDRSAEHRRGLDARIARLEAEVARLVQAIASGVESEGVAEGLAEREDALARARAERTESGTPPPPPSAGGDPVAQAEEMRAAIAGADAETQNRLLRERVEWIDYDPASQELVLHVHAYGAKSFQFVAYACTARVGR